MEVFANFAGVCRCKKDFRVLRDFQNSDVDNKNKANSDKGRGSDLRRTILELLKSPDLDKALCQLCRLPMRRVIRYLFSFICSSDQEIKWRSITAMGLVVSRLADENMESARVIMRRLMWSLNEESGSIGWGAPEAMGEIMACQEGLAREYAHILISYIRHDGNFLEYELLQRGVVWGLGRLAQVRPQLLKNAGEHLYPYLESGDASVRGLAAWTAGLIGAKETRLYLERLLTDRAPLQLYLDRKLLVCTVADLAKQALAALGAKKNFQA